MGYYENMHGKAIKYCGRVADAKTACQTAKIKIRAALQTVSESWQGQAGTAYFDALTQWLGSLEATIIRLESLEVQMRQEAEMVLTYWPQEAKDVLSDLHNAD